MSVKVTLQQQEMQSEAENGAISILETFKRFLILCFWGEGARGGTKLRFGTAAAWQEAAPASSEGNRHDLSVCLTVGSATMRGGGGFKYLRENYIKRIIVIFGVASLQIGCGSRGEL